MRLVPAVSLGLLLAVAQAPRPACAEEPKAAPSPRPSPAGEVSATPEAPRVERGQPLNVRVDVRITSQIGSEPAEVKLLSVLVADRQHASLRVGSVPAGGHDVRTVPLNMDVGAEVDGDRVLLRMTLGYGVLEPAPEGAERGLRTESINSASVLLEDGKPLVVFRSSDPLSERAYSVEVTATILR